MCHGNFTTLGMSGHYKTMKRKTRYDKLRSLSSKKDTKRSSKQIKKNASTKKSSSASRKRKSRSSSKNENAAAEAKSENTEAEAEEVERTCTGTMMNDSVETTGGAGGRHILDFTQWTKRQATSCFTPNMPNTTWTTTRAKERKRCITPQMRRENRQISWPKMRMQKQKQKELKARPQKPCWMTLWRQPEGQVKNILNAARWTRNQVTSWVWRASRAMRTFRRRGRFCRVTCQHRHEREKKRRWRSRRDSSSKRDWGDIKGWRWNPKTHRGEKKHTHRRETAPERSEANA